MRGAARGSRSAAIRKFNNAAWPRDVGLEHEFPFRIWRAEQKRAEQKRATLGAADVVRGEKWNA